MIAFLFGCTVGWLVSANWDTIKEAVEEAYEEVRNDEP